MSTVILLSSSPPRAFARSPTPADSSSPLPSTATILQDRSPARKRFKAQSCQRDGFAAGFTTGRQILAEKKGAENAIIGSPGRNRFRSSQEDPVETDSAKCSTAEPRAATKRQNIKLTPTSPSVQRVTLGQDLGADEAYTGAVVEERTGRSRTEPLLLERAVARRLDWTPPQTASLKSHDENRVECLSGLRTGMFSTFSYADNTRVVDKPLVEVSNPAKRRRIEHVATPVRQNSKVFEKPEPVEAVPASVQQAKKRNCSPTKKTLTITGLATSNYFGQDVTESPMMQYLTSTQAQLHDPPANGALETKVQKTKATTKKLKTSKKTQPKSLLLSPTSAMESYHEQETIFGSASQLVGEESPTFLRDTVEAMRQSESFLMSDPRSSPQQTQPHSVENTPQIGTARFRKTRNLWAAAGRDEDNALLHVEMVDLTDTPAIRAAFTGKDVMLQPGNKTSAITRDPAMSLRGGWSPRASQNVSNVVDIGDIPIPSPTSIRALSSTSKASLPRKSPGHVRKQSEQRYISKATAEVPTKQPQATKPNYAGLSIHDLNKQIKAYGFKAMRKREKMVELLDRCWEEKHGAGKESAESEIQIVPFGDILSKVHDISARPEPKTKKSRVRKKKESTGEETTEKPARKPRQRKPKNDGDMNEASAQEKPRVPRKKKSKVASSNRTTVFDIDGMLDTIPEDLRQLEAFDDWARPERKMNTKGHSERALLPTLEFERPPTPPATLPLDAPSTSCTIISNNEIPANAKVDTVANGGITTPAATPPLKSISFQITEAIQHQMHSSATGRNHNIDPTWHEKILLYDPIVLEDLATWLNTEGLGAVGEDREVSALDVRDWCEAQGICCLWRGGWRGNKSAQ